MKKTTFLIVVFIISFSSYAQNSLFENLSKYDGKDFKQFEVSTAHGFSITPFNHETAKPIVTIVKNQYNKPIGLTITKRLYDTWNIKFRKANNALDHYTQPAYVREFNKHTTHDAFVMVDDLLFSLTRTSEDMSDYKITAIWIPTSALNKKVAKKATSDKKSKKKKKGRFGSFIKKLKETTSLKGLSLPGILKQYKSKEDLHNIIDTYVASMRVKQKENPLTAQDRNEMAGMKSKLKAEDDAVIKANNDYWNSEEGKAKLRDNYGYSGNDWYIYNASNHEISIINEQGHITTISKGRKQSEICGRKVYYSVNGNRGNYIGNGSGNNCGKTINIK